MSIYEDKLVNEIKQTAVTRYSVLYDPSAIDVEVNSDEVHVFVDIPYLSNSGNIHSRRVKLAVHQLHDHNSLLRTAGVDAYLKRCTLVRRFISDRGSLLTQLLSRHVAKVAPELSALLTIKARIGPAPTLCEPGQFRLHSIGATVSYRAADGSLKNSNFVTTNVVKVNLLNVVNGDAVGQQLRRAVREVTAAALETTVNQLGSHCVQLLGDLVDQVTEVEVEHDRG